MLYFVCHHLCKKGKEGGEDNIHTFANISWTIFGEKRMVTVILVVSVEGV